MAVAVGLALLKFSTSDASLELCAAAAAAALWAAFALVPERENFRPTTRSRKDEKPAETLLANAGADDASLVAAVLVFTAA
jgi:hypothetical protein